MAGHACVALRRSHEHTTCSFPVSRVPKPSLPLYGTYLSYRLLYVPRWKI